MCYSLPGRNAATWGQCDSIDDFEGHAEAFHLHQDCDNKQGGMYLWLSTTVNVTYSLKFQCHAGPGDGDTTDVDYFEVSTDGGCTWQKYGCNPGGWNDIVHIFTASDTSCRAGLPSGYTELILWSDIGDCVNLDNFILEKGPLAAPTPQS